MIQLFRLCFTIRMCLDSRKEEEVFCIRLLTSKKNIIWRFTLKVNVIVEILFAIIVEELSVSYDGRINH
jgi:hypothetical protein